MYVKRCWRTKDTKEGKIHISKSMTVKEAMKRYKEEIEPYATKAYLRHFDGWHHRIYKTLKNEANKRIERTQK